MGKKYTPRSSSSLAFSRVPSFWNNQLQWVEPSKEEKQPKARYPSGCLVSRNGVNFHLPLQSGPH